MSKRSDISGLTPGEDISLRWTITDDTGTPITDMTGWQVALYVLRSLLPGGDDAALAAAALVVKRTGGEGITLSPPDVVTSFTAADTSGLAPGLYWYELWRSDPGNRRRLAYGGLVFEP